MEEPHETTPVLRTPAAVVRQETSLSSIPQPHTNSLATFLDYLDAFYEALESALEEVARMTQATGNMPYPPPYIKQQYEGQYQCRCDLFFTAMGYLVKLLYETMRKGAASKLGAKLLATDECELLFECLAIHAGFYNTLVYDYRTTFIYRTTYKGIDSYVRLLDFTLPFSEELWQEIRQVAIHRIKHNTFVSYGKDYRGDNVYLIESVSEHGDFLYPIFGRDEAETIITNLVSSEVKRFQRFLEAFHGTLQFLTDTAPLAGRKIKPPVFDWHNRKDALRAFSDICHLLRAISTGSVPTLQANLVEGSLSTSAPEELLQIEVAGTVLLLSTRDTAVIFHADASYKGRQVELTTAYGECFIAYVVERRAEKTTEYAAIFPRLPLYGATSMHVTITHGATQPSGVSNPLVVTVFAGNVTQAYLKE